MSKAGVQFRFSHFPYFVYNLNRDSAAKVKDFVMQEAAKAEMFFHALAHKLQQFYDRIGNLDFLKNGLSAFINEMETELRTYYVL